MPYEYCDNVRKEENLFVHVLSSSCELPSPGNLWDTFVLPDESTIGPPDLRIWRLESEVDYDMADEFYTVDIAFTKVDGEIFIVGIEIGSFNRELTSVELRQFHQAIYYDTMFRVVTGDVEPSGDAECDEDYGSFRWNERFDVMFEEYARHNLHVDLEHSRVECIEEEHVHKDDKRPPRTRRCLLRFESKEPVTYHPRKNLIRDREDFDITLDGENVNANGKCLWDFFYKTSTIYDWPFDFTPEGHLRTEVIVHVPNY